MRGKGELAAKSETGHQEAPGSSHTPGTVPGTVSAIGAQVLSPGNVSGMSNQQLKNILRQRRSAKEQGLLNQADGEMATLTVAVPMAVGATLELDVSTRSEGGSYG